VSRHVVAELATDVGRHWWHIPCDEIGQLGVAIDRQKVRSPDGANEVEEPNVGRLPLIASTPRDIGQRVERGHSPYGPTSDDVRDG